MSNEAPRSAGTGPRAARPIRRAFRLVVAVTLDDDAARLASVLLDAADLLGEAYAVDSEVRLGTK